MLSLSKEIICNIVLKAREFQANEGVIVPEDNAEAAEYDFLQILAAHEDDFTYVEFQNLINDLEPDQQEELIALMYIGRGDFEMSEIKEAMETARNIPIARRADYLITKPLLANFLEESLSQLGYSCDA